MTRAIGLADAIKALRQELATAMFEGRDESFVFQLSSIDLTVEVAVADEGSGRIGWQVLGVGASHGVTRGQTLHLSLTPLVRDDAGKLTEPYVADDLGGVRAFGRADGGSSGQPRPDGQ